MNFHRISVYLMGAITILSVIALAKVSAIEILGNNPLEKIIDINPLNQTSSEGGGGSGGNVTSVSSGDTYLVINPTTGDVVARIDSSVLNNTIEQIASKYNESGGSANFANVAYLNNSQDFTGVNNFTNENTWFGNNGLAQVVLNFLDGDGTGQIFWTGSQNSFGMLANLALVNLVATEEVNATSFVGSGAKLYNVNFSLQPNSTTLSINNITNFLYNYNQSDGSFNLTYALWAYNQSLNVPHNSTIVSINNVTDFLYNYNQSGSGVDTWAGNLTSGLDESLFFKDNINASFGNSKADSDGWLYSDGNNLITQLRTITEVGFTSRPQIIYNKTKVTCFGGNCIYIPWTQYKNGITNGWGAIDKGLFLKSSDDQDPFIYIVGKNYGDETTTSTLINYDVSENITYISQGTSLFSFDFRTKTNFTDIVRMGQNLYVTQNISGGQNYRVNYPFALKFTGGISPGACSAYRASNYISPPYYTQNAGQQINFVISKADGTLDRFTINGRITNFNNSRNMTNGNLNYTLLIDGTRHLIGQQDFFATGDFNYTNYSMNLNVNQNSSVQAYLEYTKVNFSISNNNDFCYDYIYMDVEELYDR